MIAAADDLLRGRRSYAPGRGAVPWRQLLAFVLLFGCLYGCVLGSFGGRGLQALYSACKVPLLLLVSTAVCLPNFYVVNVLLGLRDDWSAACRAIFAAQGTFAIMLAALAPVTALVYVSSDHYELAIVANGLMFAIGTTAAQLTMNLHYRALVRHDRRHLIGRAAWVLLYVFVAIQLAWVLRPFLGAPDLPTRFLREDAWTNAYVAVAGVLARLFGS
ncbi:MAG: hypothetical protein JNM25_06300 [Planctomycetes bacterium]|nr:hypothetical protein [Planctomycetota bacterium]